MNLFLADDEFMNAVSTTIDALSFAQTHTADLNFRAHARGHTERISNAQREQALRVNAQFGPQAPSPEFIGTQLLAEYRGEAASVQLSREAAAHSNTTTTTNKNNNILTSNAISKMNDSECKAFKKELKQRIHEWERAVKESKHQEEVLDEQKTPLRAIYELYKTCKNAVLINETSGRKSDAEENRYSKNDVEHTSTEWSNENASSNKNIIDGVAPSAREGGAVVGTHIYKENKMPDNRCDNELLLTDSTRAAQKSIQNCEIIAATNIDTGNISNKNVANAESSTKSINKNNSNLVKNNDNNNNNNILLTSKSASSIDNRYTDLSVCAPKEDTSVTSKTADTHINENENAVNAFAKAVEEEIVEKLPHVKLGTTKASIMSDNDLIEEKRRIKQVLYSFETEFQKLTGEHPVREYRRGLKKEYHRYSELKNELARRSGTAVNSNNTNSNNNNNIDNNTKNDSTSVSRARSTQERKTRYRLYQ